MRAADLVASYNQYSTARREPLHSATSPHGMQRRVDSVNYDPPLTGFFLSRDPT